MSTEDKRRTCFVISPIGESGSKDREAADKVLKHLIKKALDLDYDIKRGDDDANPGAITPQIIASITDADLIVADLSGLNPNVFYELAVAHGYQKPTVLIQKKEDKIPFDVKDMRVVRYNIADPDELEDAQKLLLKYAQYTQKQGASVTNPLTAGARFVSVADSGDPIAEGYVQVIEAVNSLASDVKRAMRVGAEHGRSIVERADPSAEADILALKEIITRAATDAALRPSHLYNAIGELTSSGFDGWVTHLAQNHLPDMDHSLLTHEDIRFTFAEVPQFTSEGRQPSA